MCTCVGSGLDWRVKTVNHLLLSKSVKSLCSCPRSKDVAKTVANLNCN